MSFDLRDHTADVAVEATGETLGDVFAATADGMTGAMCDRIPPDGGRFDIEVSAESQEALLFDYLDELIFQRDIRGVLPAEHEATVTEDEDGWTVTASARGVPLQRVSAREVKAVTYSQMQLTHTDEGWRAYVVFDV